MVTSGVGAQQIRSWLPAGTSCSTQCHRSTATGDAASRGFSYGPASPPPAVVLFPSLGRCHCFFPRPWDSECLNSPRHPLGPGVVRCLGCVWGGFLQTFGFPPSPGLSSGSSTSRSPLVQLNTLPVAATSLPRPPKLSAPPGSCPAVPLSTQLPPGPRPPASLAPQHPPGPGPRASVLPTRKAPLTNLHRTSSFRSAELATHFPGHPRPIILLTPTLMFSGFVFHLSAPSHPH